MVTLFIQERVRINRNINSIFSSLVTLVIKVGRLYLVTLFIQVSVRIDHLSIPFLRDASPTIYFQPSLVEIALIQYFLRCLHSL